MQTWIIVQLMGEGLAAGVAAQFSNYAWARVKEAWGTRATCGVRPVVAWAGVAMLGAGLLLGFLKTAGVMVREAMAHAAPAPPPSPPPAPEPRSPRPPTTAQPAPPVTVQPQSPPPATAQPAPRTPPIRAAVLSPPQAQLEIDAAPTPKCGEEEVPSTKPKEPGKRFRDDAE